MAVGNLCVHSTITRGFVRRSSLLMRFSPSPFPLPPPRSECSPRRLFLFFPPSLIAEPYGLSTYEYIGRLSWESSNSRLCSNHPVQNPHTSAQEEKSQTKISQDFNNMAFLIDNLSKNWWEIWNHNPASNQDMRTLIYNLWQPWNIEYKFVNFWWYLYWIRG